VSLFMVVEGDGDKAALPELVERLRTNETGLASLPFTPKNGVGIHNLSLDKARGESRLTAMCEQYRSRESVTALLVTQDSDDTCPKNFAPTLASWVRPLDLTFPVAIVLFYREYETLFLAASNTLQGAELKGRIARTGLPKGAVYQGLPEEKRGAKGWVGEQLGRKYVETIDQAAFTRTLDLSDERLRELSSYRRLMNGLSFLARHAGSGKRGEVYPK
jgi:hypothetical protein